MRKLLLITLLMAMTVSLFAQNATEARKVLDKTAAVVSSKNGAQANFKLSTPNVSAASGTIAIKGNKFNARTAAAIVWFDGKTQWTWLKKTNEVNVTTPTEAQRMKMNPYTFITMYKQGYNLSMTTQGNNYQVHMTAQNKQRGVQEVYLTISKSTYTPSIIKMREGQKWTTITISNFKAANLPNSTFTFNAKEFPSAEVVDLR